MVITREQMQAVVDKIDDVKLYLDDRKYNILMEWLKGRTFESIAKDYNLTRNSIRNVINGIGFTGKYGIYRKLIIHTRKDMNRV